MVHQNLLIVLVLFFFMVLLYLLSERVKMSYPIFLVIGGLSISFVPGIPNVNIDPDIVFLIFLPPLLFEAAWNTSWRNFLTWKRSIFSMGFGLVFSTSLAVAYLSIMIIPDFTLALGFLLGGIISPPDAVAATSILKGMKMPRSGLTILEGESLVNDAASLTVFRFATIAILTNQFVFRKAVIDFAVLAFMGVAVGLVVAYLLFWILRSWAKSSRMTTPITIIAPYLMYIIAEEFHWSGVLAVVSGGLYLSSHAKDFLNYRTRLQNKEVWNILVFLLNGFVFILIGLELPMIVEGLGSYSLKEAIGYGLLISGIVILIRIILVYLTFFLPRLLSSSIRRKEPTQGWKLPFIIGWAGMRGVVSLAAALTIPLTMDNGSSFPHRNLILFITFVVILITLVFQGLTLPVFLRILKVEEAKENLLPNEQMDAIRLRLARQSATYLESNYSSEMAEYSSIQRIMEQIRRTINATAAGKEQDEKDLLDSAQDLNKKILLELLQLRRLGLHSIHEENLYDEEVIRDLENNLDLEESRLNKR